MAHPLRALQRLGALTYGVYAWAVFALFGTIAWFGVMFLPGSKVHRAILRACVYSVLALIGIPLKVQGRDQLLNTSPCVVVANHASYLDAMVLIALLPAGYGFVAKRELARNWLLRIFLQRLDTHFVERFDPRRGATDMRRLARAARQGQALVFFPEGTFHPEPGVATFRMGAFVAAVQGSLPVLPVVLRGTRRVLPSEHWLPRRGRLEVQFLAPLAPAGSDWAAAVRLRDASRQLILAHAGEPDLGR